MSRSPFIRSLTAAFCLLPSNATLSAYSSPAPERDEVQAVVRHFLVSFENLDIDAFMASFAHDATVFFPTPEPPDRFDGKNAIRDHFLKVFAAIRSSSKASAPPYHRLEPEQLEVQIPAPGSAVVTFHLRNSERTARRTLVLAKVAGHWLIVHLHASNLAAPATTPMSMPAATPRQ